MIQKIAPVAPEKSSKSNEIPAYEAYKVEGDNAAPPIVRGPSKREIKKNPPNRKAMVNTNHQLVILSGGISIPPSFTLAPLEYLHSIDTKQQDDYQVICREILQVIAINNEYLYTASPRLNNLLPALTNGMEIGGETDSVFVKKITKRSNVG